MLGCYTSRCAACPGKRRVVPGGGPTPCRTLFLGEAPGGDEDRTGVAFSGRAGNELNNDYLIRSGTTRDQAFVTNTVLCRPDDNKKPDDWIPGLARTCAQHHLPSELYAVRPEIVVLMGATACELVEGDPIDLEVDHGIVQENTLFGKRVTVFPTYHPALGLHEPRAIKDLRFDFDNLKRELAVRGSTVPRNLWPDVDYGVLDSSDHCREDWDILEALILDRWLLGVDTETDGEDDEDWSANPYSIQVSPVPGWARWVDAFDVQSLNRLGRLAEKYRDQLTVVFHNAPFDIPVSRKMGIGFDRFNWEDTMFRSFHLSMRHGLKTLGWRLAGVRMKSFDELVRPRWEVEAWKFLRQARLFAEAVEKPEKVEIVISKGKRKGQTQMRTPWYILPALKRVFSDLEGGRFTVYPGKRWKNIEEWMRKSVTDLMGEDMPRFSIRYADREEAVWYGCQDADVTVRAHLELEREDWPDKVAMRGVGKWDRDSYADLRREEEAA